MDSMTPYPPLTRAPLRMRGIFGIAWQLYKRGFFPMFLLSLLFVTLPTLLMTLPQFALYDRMGLWTDMQSDLSRFGQLSSVSSDMGLQEVGALFGTMGLLFLVGLVVTFLLMPMYQGALFLEMEERMEGRAGTIKQLFRYALPIGLKRFYTTFLAEYVLNLAIGVVVFIIYMVGAMSLIFSAVFSLRSFEGGELPTSFFVTLGLIVLLIVAIAVCLSVFLMLIYPVAVHEKKFAFAAVGRAFKLTVKRFWRMLGATLLLSLVMSVASGLLSLPALLLWQDVGAMFVLLSVLTAVAAGLLTPYAAAFQTALYVDTAARVDGPEISVIDPDSVPDPDPEELREGPRTL